MRRQKASGVVHGEIGEVNDGRSPISSGCASMILRVSVAAVINYSRGDGVCRGVQRIPYREVRAPD
jgi:hypothetical protein